MSSRLAFSGVSHTYGRLAALHGLDLTVAPGEVVCLLGPSGCGKTTTLRIAAGVERQSAGQVWIDGRLVADGSTFVPPERRGVGLMFQDYALFPHLTVLENVAFGLHKRPKDERTAIAAEALDRVGLSRYAQSHPHMLSGGEQQRVALARAMAPEPAIMLMDEPFSGLDNRLRDAVRDQALDLLAHSGASALLVTHDPEEALRMADRIALLRAGHLVQLGTPADLYYSPVDVAAAAFFSDINLFPGRVENGAARCILGSFPVSGIADGTPVDVVVRPRALALEAAGTGTPATVRRARLMGEDCLLTLELDGHEPLVQARISGRTAPEEGARAGVSAVADRVLVFPAG